jgi:hypothetical protein
MPISKEIDIEHELLRLLREADPSVTESDPVVREFASLLASLTDDWATGSPTLNARKRRLDQWIRHNSEEPLEVTASANSGLLAEAEGDVEAEAGADAGLDA